MMNLPKIRKPNYLERFAHWVVNLSLFRHPFVFAVALVSIAFFVAFHQTEPRIEDLIEDVEVTQETVVAQGRICIGTVCWEYNGPVTIRQGFEDGKYPVDVLDLHKQSVMAHWTVAIGFFTLMGIIVVIYTFLRTARLTRNIAESTKEIGQKQVKAYPAIGSAKLRIATELRLETDHKVLGNISDLEPRQVWSIKELQFKIVLVNSGQSPLLKPVLTINAEFYIAHSDDNLVVSTTTNPPQIGAGREEEVPIKFGTTFVNKIIDFQDITKPYIPHRINVKLDGIDVFGQSVPSEINHFAIASTDEFEPDTIFDLKLKQSNPENVGLRNREFRQILKQNDRIAESF